jgi:hypothetical protein
MVYDMILLQQEKLEDATTGINARMDTLTTAVEEFDLPRVQQFEYWDYPLPTEWKATPGLAVVWAPGNDMRPRSQHMYLSTWRFEWHLWVQTESPEEELQKFLAIAAHAMRYVLEDLVDHNDVDEIEDPRIDVTGWREAGRRFGLMVLGYNLRERENA